MRSYLYLENEGWEAYGPMNKEYTACADFLKTILKKVFTYKKITVFRCRE